MARGSLGELLTNLNQPMPLPEKLFKLTRNLWLRVVLRQACCGHDGEPGLLTPPTIPPVRRATDIIIRIRISNRAYCPLRRLYWSARTKSS